MSPKRMRTSRRASSIKKGKQVDLSAVMAPSQPRRPGPVTRSMTKGKHSDPLHSLPHELLRLILSKITDPKTLLVSSLISKPIASTLSNFQSLSLQFPFPPTEEEKDHWHNLFHRVTSLLRIFNRVRSLRIELPCSYYYSDGKGVFKWKAKTGLRCFVLSLLFSSELVSKIDGKKVKVEEEEEEEGGHGEVEEAAKDLVAMGLVSYACRMYRLMLLLVSRHPNIDNVELMDSKKRGKLSLHGEALIKLRTTMLDSLDFTGDFWHVRTWYVPKLLLAVDGVCDEEGDIKGNWR